MALIDHTYFVGELFIPTPDTDAEDRLRDFIPKCEERFLTELFGYDLYHSFITGLNDSPIDEIWTNVLTGTQYIHNGRYFKWNGLIQLPAGVNATINTNSSYLEMVVGRGKVNDPVPGSTTVTIPSSFSNVPVILDRRGIGQMASAEFSIVGTTLTLLDGTVFNQGETFFLKKGATIGITPVTRGRKTSIIANYVYYWWHRNEITQSTNIGEVISKSENSTVVGPGYKMVRAWNEMVDQVWQLVYFLDNNILYYPSWSWYNGVAGTTYWQYYNHTRLTNIFSPINTMNL